MTDTTNTIYQCSVRHRGHRGGSHATKMITRRKLQMSAESLKAGRAARSNRGACMTWHAHVRVCHHNDGYGLYQTRACLPGAESVSWTRGSGWHGQTRGTTSQPRCVTAPRWAPDWPAGQPQGSAGPSRGSGSSLLLLLNTEKQDCQAGGQ